MKKRTLILSTLLISSILFGGCASQQGKLDYITPEKAKATALEDAGFAADEVNFTAADLNERNGQDYYAIDFTADDEQYTYDIDALTGSIINSQVSSDDDSSKEAATSAPQEETTTAEAQKDTAASSEDTASKDERIGKEKAKQIALDHANLDESKVTFVKVGIDWDDGVEMYDVEFYSSDYTEHDYDIDAYTGEILSYDHDAEYYKPASAEASSSSKEISEAKAKKIALGQVPGASEGDIVQFETDYDDGRLEYEGKIYYDGMEYEFEIDGYSGAIRNWDAEPIGD